MAIAIRELSGMTNELADKLKARGVSNSDQLLEMSKTPKQRKELATQAEVKIRDILELANRADLSRIKGIGGVYSDLLEKVGVDTVKELATRRPDNLHAKIEKVNGDENIVKQTPSPSLVESWVSQAKSLPKMLEY